MRKILASLVVSAVALFPFVLAGSINAEDGDAKGEIMFIVSNTHKRIKSCQRAGDIRYRFEKDDRICLLNEENNVREWYRVDHCAFVLTAHNDGEAECWGKSHKNVSQVVYVSFLKAKDRLHESADSR